MGAAHTFLTLLRTFLCPQTKPVWEGAFDCSGSDWAEFTIKGFGAAVKREGTYTLTMRLEGENDLLPRSQGGCRVSGAGDEITELASLCSKCVCVCVICYMRQQPVKAVVVCACISYTQQLKYQAIATGCRAIAHLPRDMTWVTRFVTSFVGAARLQVLSHC